MATLRYRQVLADAGGPIERITSSQVSIYGRNAVQANAFLTVGLAPRKPENYLNESADGAGSSQSAETARHKAVSEALERWAFHTEATGPNASRYGFQHDRSSTGMAAFPGLFRGQARKRARMEALERLAIVAWWDGRALAASAGTTFAGINVLRIHHPGESGEVVLVYRKSKTGHVSYGHAAGDSVSSATAHAIVELAHNEFIVTCHKLHGRTQQVNDCFERRCLHFAGPDGFQEFLSKIDVAPSKSAASWDPIYDGELVGPWSRYATVWRTSLRMPTQAYLDPRENFFFW